MSFLDIHKLQNNIEQLAKYELDNNNAFGLSYYVWQKESAVFEKHFGSTDIDDKNNVNDGTIYRLASMTKPITAVAILILVDRGLVSLDDPVSKYIHGFEDVHIVTADGNDLGITKTPVTLFHCLTHTSGIGSEKFVAMSEHDRETILSTIECYLNAGLDFEPSSREAYSPVAAFDVLAAIVEKVTNQDYESFLKNEIFIPCNMTDTTFSPSDEQWKRIIAMHNNVDGKNCVGITYPECVFETFPCDHYLAGAGLVSTLKDYSNFAKMLLNKGKSDGNKVLSEKTLKLLSTPYVQKGMSPSCESWGLGVRVITDGKYPYLPVGSFGWSGAYGTHFWIDSKNDIFAVFMRNSRYDGGSGSKASLRFEKAVWDALE